MTFGVLSTTRDGEDWRGQLELIDSTASSHDRNKSVRNSLIYINSLHQCNIKINLL